jgi:hypothetical protein
MPNDGRLSLYLFNNLVLVHVLLPQVEFIEFTLHPAKVFQEKDNLVLVEKVKIVIPAWPQLPDFMKKFQSAKRDYYQKGALVMVRFAGSRAE